MATMPRKSERPRKPNPVFSPTKKHGGSNDEEPRASPKKSTYKLGTWVQRCGVAGCKSRMEKGNHFKLPSQKTEPDLLRQWMEALNMADEQGKLNKAAGVKRSALPTYKICSIHFPPSMIRHKPENPSEKELVPGALPLRWDPPPFIPKTIAKKPVLPKPKSVQKSRGRPRKHHHLADPQAQGVGVNFDTANRPPATFSTVNQPSGPSISHGIPPPKAIPSFYKGEASVLSRMGILPSAFYHMNQPQRAASVHTTSPHANDQQMVRVLPQFRSWNTSVQTTTEVVTLPFVEEEVENEEADMDPLAVDLNHEPSDPSQGSFNSASEETEIEVKTESWLQPFSATNFEIIE